MGRQEPKMIAIAIFTLVICCIGVEGHHGVESLPGDAKRETTGCSVLFFFKSSGTNSSGTNSSGQTAEDKQQWTNTNASTFSSTVSSTSTSKKIRSDSYLGFFR